MTCALSSRNQLTERVEHARIDLTGRATVVVDDVLCFGFSLQKAVQYLLDKGVR